MNSKQTNRTLVLNILKAATFLLFAGRAWQHLFWDAPFRALLWDRSLMEGIVTLLREGTWEEYVTSISTDRMIRGITVGFGIFYSLMAGLTLFVKAEYKRINGLYILASLSLAFLAFLYCKEKFYHVGQFVEYAIQFLLPVLFIYFLQDRITLSKLNLLLKISIALTFSAHGMYAIGIYPQPGNFVDMVINIFHVSESAAKAFLKIAGVLDFLLSIAIFLPRISKYALIYAVIWGGLTALARVWAHFYWSFPLQSLHQNLFETIYRLPHALIPLAALYITHPQIGRKIHFRRSSSSH